jgi:hypothetical protein
MKTASRVFHYEGRRVAVEVTTASAGFTWAFRIDAGGLYANGGAAIASPSLALELGARAAERLIEHFYDDALAVPA